MLDITSRIVIAGAGSIGCYVGGCLALAGRRVTLLLRPILADDIVLHGLRISGFGGSRAVLPASTFELSSDPQSALVAAQVLLVTVKSAATAEMAGLIAQYAPPDAVTVSFQNGIGNVEALAANLGAERTIVAGMVPFNVVQVREQGQAPHFHRASSGRMLIGSGTAGLRDVLNVSGAPVEEHRNMTAALWGKLILNLNNALNALAGMPLAEELADRRWRLLLAAQIDEALNVLRAVGIRPGAVEGVPPWAIPRILRLPDWLFRVVARRMLAIDPQARSSMWEDLLRGRITEVDYLQGVILTLANRIGAAAPMTERIVQLIKEAEKARAGSPGLQPSEIAGTPS
jgi:2-dehydropantoate 2-reductase